MRLAQVHPATAIACPDCGASMGMECVGTAPLVAISAVAAQHIHGRREEEWRRRMSLDQSKPPQGGTGVPISRDEIRRIEEQERREFTAKVVAIEMNARAAEMRDAHRKEAGVADLIYERQVIHKVDPAQRLIQVDYRVRERRSADVTFRFEAEGGQIQDLVFILTREELLLLQTGAEGAIREFDKQRIADSVRTPRDEIS